MNYQPTFFCGEYLLKNTSMKKQNIELNKEKLELLGTVFSEIRLRLNLTQAQVSEATGLHINTISNIEQGRSGRLENFIIISSLYELKPSDILAVVEL